MIYQNKNRRRLQAQAVTGIQAHRAIAAHFLQAQMQIVRAIQRGQVFDVGDR